MQNAREGVIGRNFIVFHFQWTIEPFVGKETLCLFGLVSFEERVKTGGTAEEIRNVK